MRLVEKCLVFFLAFILATSSFILPAAADSNGDTGYSLQKAEYLVDEDFSFLYSLNNSTNVHVSGWDTLAAGGSLSYSYYSWIKISDTSKVLPVSMNKKFKTQYSGKLTLEYRFKPTAAIDGLKWQLRSGSAVGVSIFTNGPNLYVDNAGNTSTLLQTYAANVEYGVKVIADITQNTADIYINGVLRASNVAFKNSVSNLDNFNISTGETSTGDLYLYTVKIYKGYTVNERFITTLANLPGDWASSASGGIIAAEKMDNASPPDIYGLKMDATNSTAAMTFRKNLPAQSGAQVFEYKALFPQKVDGLSAELLNGNAGIFKLITSNGKLCYVDGNGQAIPVYDYIANLWYSIKIKLDTASSKADIYINEKLKIQGADFAANGTGIDGIRYSTSAVNKGKMYLDDIQLYNDTPLPSDYVPAPIKVSSNDILVGTQSCSLWREGQHLGWDYINPYSDRTPVLGYYDEGNPETADWEIKWMAEHGINFQMFAWFRDKGSAVEGKPIKDGDISEALNRGYFNAKYSDQVDFTIMWENGASKAKNSADFRDNIVPYWIEYYLKDSRYLVVDNKPVIAIYSMSGLKRDFGGTVEGVKAETDYLRSEVKKLGFDDATLLISYSGADPVTFSESKAAGFDAVFNYSWGPYSGYPDVQKSKLLQQRDTGYIDMVPVISMGRDDSAWKGYTEGYYSTTNEFQSVAQWVKDTLVPSLPDASPGKKMVLLDNWNEYGEGHFIAPTALNGFGYLDAIRNVFTDGGTHEDAVPTLEQKDRVSTLYLKDRVMPPVTTANKPETTDIYTMKWEFNTNGNAEGWGNKSTKINNIENIRVADGSLSFESTGKDPWIVAPDNLSFSAIDNPYIHIRMKNGSADPNGRIYFITEEDRIWNNAKSVGVYIKPNDDGYTDYYADMWTNSKWTGNVSAFRIDPSSGPGNISIDFIGVVYSPMQGIKTYFDGYQTKLPNQAKIIDGYAMVPIEDVYNKLGIPKQWNDDPRRLIAVKDGSIYELTPGQITAYKDGNPINLEHVPVFSDGVFYAPASFLKQAFGYMVSWNDQDQQISIYTSSLTWNFTANDGWTANGRIINGRASNGYYLGTSLGDGTSGEEGYITSKDQLYMDAASVKRIRVNYMNSTPGNELKLYFTTTSDPVWDTKKMMTLPAVVSDSRYREYVFDTSSFSGWNGTIKQIRIVPTNAAGDFGVDYIKLDITSSLPLIGDNVVIDPGMELGTSTQLSNTLSVREYSTAQAHSGNQSTKITKQGTYAGVSFTNLPLVKGQEYYYSAWLKLDANSASLKKNPAQYPVAQVGLEYKLNGIKKQTIMFTSGKLNATEWQQVQGTYTINETGTVTEIRMYMYTDVPLDLDTFYIDDVEIRPVTYTTSPEWIYVSGITLNKEYTVIAPGKTEKLTATIQPVNAINKDIVWSSDNTDVAIVDKNGYVYGKSAGIANIQATTVEGGLSAVCEVVVGAIKSVTGVELNKTEEHVTIGQSTTLTASILPADASYKKVKWSSSNPEVAIISNPVYNSDNGTSSVTVSAIGTGTANITVTTIDGAKTAVYVINVVPGLNSLDLKTDKLFVKTGDTASLTLTGKMSDGTAADITNAQIVYTSNNEQVAAVDQSGTVTAVGEGPAQIKATVQMNGITKEAVIQITVDGTPAVTTVDISGTNVNGWYTSDVTITLASSDSLSGVEKTEYRLSDSGDWITYIAPVTITQDGIYTIQYRSTDKAGNVEDIKQEIVKADKTAPVSTATINGTVRSDGTYNSHVSVTLATYDAAGGSGTAGIQYSLDGINWLAYTAPLELTDNGTYSISYKATDNAGNIEVVGNASVIISMDINVMVSYLQVKVNAMSVEEGFKNSLTSKLDNVLRSITDKDKQSTVNILNAFVNEVDAQNGTKLTSEQAYELKAEAQKIIAKINM